MFDVNLQDLVNTIAMQAVEIQQLRSRNEDLERALRAAAAPVHTPAAGEGPVEGPDSPEGGADAG